ncbi:MAG: uncharacterized protein A8A55_0527 [Amphiamblys sp. WSBS2006]|nr:MAG: uncharacterized protein A8A55_0527 [Amphiamblys sp. WSBS2006]
MKTKNETGDVLISTASFKDGLGSTKSVFKERGSGYATEERVSSVRDVFRSRKEEFDLTAEVRMVRHSHTLWLLSCFTYLFNLATILSVYLAAPKWSVLSVFPLLATTITSLVCPVASYFSWHMLFCTTLKEKTATKYEVYVWQTVLSVIFSLVSAVGVKNFFTTGIFYDGADYVQAGRFFLGALCLVNGTLFLLFAALATLFLLVARRYMKPLIR